MDTVELIDITEQHRAQALKHISKWPLPYKASAVSPFPAVNFKHGDMTLVKQDKFVFSATGP